MKKIIDRFSPWIIIVLFASMVWLGVRTSRISDQNQTFLTNFSDYMRCLVVTDQELYKELGKAAYFDHCDQLLFRNTGLAPNPRPVATTTTVIK